MSRTSLLVLSICLAACSASPAPEAATPASSSSSSEAAQALFERGSALMVEGDSVRAEQYLAAALREGYDWEQALPLLMRVCLTGSRLRAGLNYAAPYLKSHPDAVWLRYLTATVYLGLGQPIKAREHLLAIEGREPYQARTQYLLGQTEWEGFGNETAAARHYREYLRVEPAGPNAREVQEWLAQHGSDAAASAALGATLPDAQATPVDPAPPPADGSPAAGLTPEASP